LDSIPTVKMDYDKSGGLCLLYAQLCDMSEGDCAIIKFIYDALGPLFIEKPSSSTNKNLDVLCARMGSICPYGPGDTDSVLPKICTDDFKGGEEEMPLFMEEKY